MDAGVWYDTANPCAWKRASLNERLPWKGPWARPASVSSRAALLQYRWCPDLAGTAVLAEAAEVLISLPRMSFVHRHFNGTNSTRWLMQVHEVRHWLRSGERQLRRLLESLGGHFEPTRWSSAPFWRAAGFLKAAQIAATLLHDQSLRSRPLPKRERSWWRALETALESDAPMQIEPPSLPAPPCSLNRALLDLLQVEELRFRTSPSWNDAVGSWIRDLLASAQRSLACMLQGTRPLQHFMFRGAHLFFLLLDRLDCRLWSAVKTRLQGPSHFWMRLLPTPYSEANVVRGFRKFHCDDTFRDLLQDVQAGKKGSFRFAEVGASLGGCTFHVLTSVDDSLAVAVEPYRLAAEAIQHTAARNELVNRLVVRQAFVSDQVGACQLSSIQGALALNPSWSFQQLDEATAAEAKQCVVTTLEEILTSAWGGFRTLDLLRVHVDGREEAVLKSLGSRLHPASVKAVALAMWPFREDDSLYDPASIADMLRVRGYEVRLHFLSPSSAATQRLWNEEAVLALRRGVGAAQTMTLVAVHAVDDQKRVKSQNARCL